MNMKTKFLDTPEIDLAMYNAAIDKIQRLEAEIAILKHQLSPLSSATTSYVAGLKSECEKLRRKLERCREMYKRDVD